MLQLQLGQRDGHAIAPSAVQRALVCCFEFFVAPEAGTVARGVHGDEDGAETTQRPEWNHNSSFPAGGPSQLGQALTSQNCPDVPRLVLAPPDAKRLALAMTLLFLCRIRPHDLSDPKEFLHGDKIAQKFTPVT